MAGAEGSEGLKELDALWGKAYTWKIQGAGVEDVWAITGDFVGVDKWMTTFLQSSELVQGEPQKPGCVRRAVVHPSPSQPSQAFGTEKLLLMDAASHHYVYSLLGSNVPGLRELQNYVAVLKLSSLSPSAHAPISSSPSPRRTQEHGISSVGNTTVRPPAPTATTTAAIHGGDRAAIEESSARCCHEEEEETTLLHWSFTCHPSPGLSEQDVYSLLFSVYEAAVNDLKQHLALPSNSITLLS